MIFTKWKCICTICLVFILCSADTCGTMDVFAVLYIGKPYHYQLERKWRILYIPAFILIGGIMTNDFHQLAFRFQMEYRIGEWNTQGIFIYSGNWLDRDILCHDPGDYIFQMCVFTKSPKNLDSDDSIRNRGSVHNYIYIKSQGAISFIIKMAEVICFIFPAFMECLILARLLPSNDSYMDLWQVSSAGGGLMDFEGISFILQRNVCQ